MRLHGASEGMWRYLPRQGSWPSLIYRLLRWGQPYVDEGAAVVEKRYQEARIQRLAATAKDLGYQLSPNPSEA